MRKISIYAVVILLAIQFIKVDIKSEIPSLARDEIQAPANIKNILKTSCYDCHSNHSTMPWYGDIAPSSWLVRSHIRDGRKVLNFSEFNTYDKVKQKKLYTDIKKSIVLRMPLGSYTMLHKDATLNKTQKQEITNWANEAKNGL